MKKRFAVLAAVAAVYALNVGTAAAQGSIEECELTGIVQDAERPDDNPFAPPRPLPETFELPVLFKCEFEFAVGGADGGTVIRKVEDDVLVYLDVEALTMIVMALDGRDLPDVPS